MLRLDRLVTRHPKNMRSNRRSFFAVVSWPTVTVDKLTGRIYVHSSIDINQHLDGEFDGLTITTPRHTNRQTSAWYDAKNSRNLKGDRQMCEQLYPRLLPSKVNGQELNPRLLDQESDTILSK